MTLMFGAPPSPPCICIGECAPPSMNANSDGRNASGIGQVWGKSKSKYGPAYEMHSKDAVLDSPAANHVLDLHLDNQHERSHYVVVPVGNQVDAPRAPWTTARPTSFRERWTCSSSRA